MVMITASLPKQVTVRVSAGPKARDSAPTPAKPRPHAPTFLLAGLAAAHLAFAPVGPAIAAEAFAPQPSIDFLSEAEAGDVLAEVENAEIPQLEARIGALSKTLSPQTVSAVQQELQNIETEVGALDEEEGKGASSEFPQEMGGLLSQITALKAAMRGAQ